MEHVKKSPVVILGIDPGTGITGYGLIRYNGSAYTPLDFGCIRTKTELPLPQRHLMIFDAIEHLIEKYAPHVMAVETQFVQKNVQSALKLGMARGVAMLAGSKKNIPIFEYSPKTAKQSVSGSGNASKLQVQHMIQILLNLKTVPEDAADALALALCHAHQMRLH